MLYIIYYTYVAPFVTYYIISKPTSTKMFKFKQNPDITCYITYYILCYITTCL